MSCVLRISGANLNLEALLRALPIKPYRSWNKGDPRTRRSIKSRIHADSGACFDVSGAGFDEFQRQQQDATAFLVENCVILQEISVFPGVEYSRLDFAIDSGPYPVHSDVLSLQFLRAAAAACVSVELSHYPSTANED
ncbi:hypothetical protein GCM10027285_20240 [Oleiagrimonas citrea]|uniref:DUF4279 domain-containing protein n=1 Tax=Oleiagrimonas citrea TaxID=1665687 RepID=A0A846ZIK5_9GAMM|nr:hypothetical protein [Oleiagrimonas citrea]NKZ37662.1 hypothetical protein [Oleiagrimonas citrea]